MRIAMLLFVLAMGAAALTPARAAPVYEKATITAAQEALTRLGYDVGNPSGKWNARTAAALNDLRSKNGLPPSSTFSGSSLALAHRISPGATTLPYAGLLITDAVQRRAFLSDKANAGIASTCSIPIDLSQSYTLLASTKDPVLSVGTKSTAGKMIAEDFYSPIMVSTVWFQGACLAGQDLACNTIVDFVLSWAKANALRPTSKFGQARFEDDSWAANVILRNSIIAYAHARSFVPVPPADEATILDWFKRRIDDYHFNKPKNLTNHALANMMPALAFGALVGDRSMMQPAFDMWHAVLGYMRKDGSFPFETKRGAWALHYQIAQIAQLISVGEIAKAQEIDLYATTPDPAKNIQTAVGFVVSSLERFDTYYKYAKAMDAAGDDDDYRKPRLQNFHFGWLPAYYERFGEDANLDRMGVAKVDSRLFGESDMTIAKAISRLGTAPHHFMGYPAACLEGTVAWPLAKP